MNVSNRNSKESERDRDKEQVFHDVFVPSSRELLASNVRGPSSH
jgi:hypothetical protein